MGTPTEALQVTCACGWQAVAAEGDLLWIDMDGNGRHRAHQVTPPLGESTPEAGALLVRREVDEGLD